MKLLRTLDASRNQIETALKRSEVGRIRMSEEGRKRSAQIFGKPLDPEEAVRTIIDDVAKRGDAALLHYIKSIDGAELSPGELISGRDEMEAALDHVRSEEPELIESLEVARDSVRDFHSRQLPNSWTMDGPGGSVLGQRYVPIEKVGIYVPGGTAPLVSSVIMCAVPAKVAGVGKVVMATPVGPGGRVNKYLLAAAGVSGVDMIVKAGGAQAIAALAYGTETVPAVDKIVGPGNTFVTLAKRMVFGKVGIDMLAGPSEIMVIADGSADPDLVAADLLSQAEHDPEAGVLLLTDSEDLARDVLEGIEEQKAMLSRKGVIERSLESYGVCIVCRSIEEACELANYCAPEHLELVVEKPFEILPLIRNAGAIFLGNNAPEPVGDYVAGPNHVLPTNGTARFSSPLSVDDFLKKSSLIYYTPQAMEIMGPHAVRLAMAEGLDAHANSAGKRLRKEGRQGA